MTDKEYRASPGISRSELWKLNPRTGGSPEKFKFAQEAAPTKPTPAMALGLLAHTALLEPHTFDDLYAIAPAVDRRTKAGKEAMAAFEAELGDRQIVSMDDWETACVMAHVASGFPFARKLLSGSHEEVFRWTDEATGEECKIRVDAIVNVGGTPVIIDYKTTMDASTDAFTRKALQMGYDFQAGMYCEGVERVTGKRPRFVFIAQETSEPYAVNILEADEGFVQRGKDIFRELIGIYHECRLTDEWYGYMGANCTIGRLTLPAWAEK